MGDGRPDPHAGGQVAYRRRECRQVVGVVPLADPYGAKTHGLRRAGRVEAEPWIRGGARKDVAAEAVECGGTAVDGSPRCARARHGLRQTAARDGKDVGPSESYGLSISW